MQISPRCTSTPPSPTHSRSLQLSLLRTPPRPVTTQTSTSYVAYASPLGASTPASGANPFPPASSIATHPDCNCDCRATVQVLAASIEMLQTKLTAVEGELRALGQRVRGTKGTAKEGGELNVEFNDQRLLDCKASSFLTGRVLTSDECANLVRKRFENVPPYTFDTDDIRRINIARGCGNAPSLAKWAVFELFSVRDLVGGLPKNAGGVLGQQRY